MTGIGKKLCLEIIGPVPSQRIWDLLLVEIVMEFLRKANSLAIADNQLRVIQGPEIQFIKFSSCLSAISMKRMWILGANYFWATSMVISSFHYLIMPVSCRGGKEKKNKKQWKPSKWWLLLFKIYLVSLPLPLACVWPSKSPLQSLCVLDKGECTQLWVRVTSTPRLITGLFSRSWKVNPHHMF